MAARDILLTGASGFIGFRTLLTALEQGYTVRAAVRNEQKATTIRSHPKLNSFGDDKLSFVVVPDIIADGAFDEAVRGVKSIVHVASPLPGPHITGEDDLDAVIIQPAIQGTLGVLRSAQKAGGIQRIVITSSSAAIMPILLGQSTDQIFGPDSRIEAIPFPYGRNPQTAYCSSKVLALQHAENFITHEKPSFDVIHIHPFLVFGRDEMALTSADVDSGSNFYALGPVLGRKGDVPFVVAVTDVGDVALAHIRALDPSVPGNSNFLLSNTGDEGYSWEDIKRFAEKHFPDAVKEGILPNDGFSPDATISVDVSETRRLLGIEGKSLEDMVVPLLRQYVELKREELK